MLKENTNVLSVIGFLCSLYGSDGMIWSLDTLFYKSDDAARAKTTRVNVHVLYVNRFQCEPKQLNSLPIT